MKAIVEEETPTAALTRQFAEIEEWAKGQTFGNPKYPRWWDRDKRNTPDGLERYRRWVDRNVKASLPKTP
jgi:hypothetical protein